MRAVYTTLISNKEDYIMEKFNVGCFYSFKDDISVTNFKNICYSNKIIVRNILEASGEDNITDVVFRVDEMDDSWNVTDISIKNINTGNYVKMIRNSTVIFLHDELSGYLKEVSRTSFEDKLRARFKGELCINGIKFNDIEEFIDFIA